MGSLIVLANDLLIVIPARGGSKRLPGKNLMKLGNRSLIARTADFVRSEGFINSAILSTEDAEIAAEGLRCGLAVPFLRPAELAKDETSTLEVVLNALDWYRNDRQAEPAYLVVLQVTSPFRRKGLLCDAMQSLQRNAHANSVVAMTRLHVSTRYVFSLSTSGKLSPITEANAPAVIPTGSLYLVRTRALRALNSIIAPPTLAVEVSRPESIDIDTGTDMLLAEAMIADFMNSGCDKPSGDWG